VSFLHALKRYQTLYSEWVLTACRWVIRHDGYYYMTYTTNNDVTLLRSQVLTYVNFLVLQYMLDEICFTMILALTVICYMVYPETRMAKQASVLHLADTITLTDT
jgi:hypothetical protein